MTPCAAKIPKSPFLQLTFTTILHKFNWDTFCKRSPKSLPPEILKTFQWSRRISILSVFFSKQIDSNKLASLLVFNTKVFISQRAADVGDYQIVFFFLLSNFQNLQFTKELSKSFSTEASQFNNYKATELKYFTREVTRKNRATWVKFDMFTRTKSFYLSKLNKDFEKKISGKSLLLLLESFPKTTECKVNFFMFLLYQ